MIQDKLLQMQEFAAAGLFENPERSLFYRKAVSLRRYYETTPLPPYRGERLYPSGQISTPDYQNNLVLNMQKIEEAEPSVAARIRQDFFRYSSTVPPEHSVAGNMWTHSMPYYERILKEGFSGYAARIQRMQSLELREGLLQLVEGISNYIQRCVTYLEEAQASPELISTLRKVPMHPAETIYEAVVAWNFILYLDGCDNLGCLVSGLAPYHRGENIIDLLENLFDNLDCNNGYSMAIHVSESASPLALQCLEAAKGKRRPMIELFADSTTPTAVWEKAFELVRSGSGQPAFYNPAVLLPGLMEKCGVSPEDARRFCGGGCTEAMIAGLSNVGSLDAGIHLPLLLEQVIYTQLADSPDFESFYRCYIQKVSETVESVTAAISHSQLERAKYNPLPLRTLLIDDCIEKEKEYNNGGAKYSWSIINFAGMINVIDGLLVIRDFVFAQKAYTPASFIRCLQNSDSAFLEKARNHPICFGKDCADADAFAHRLSSEIFALLADKKPALGNAFLPASIQFMSQVDAGRAVGATPDGRHAKAPLCDSLAAIFGKDTDGPTALLKSVTALDLKNALGVPVLNFNINPTFENSILRALILGYMQLGGIQLQITCISRAQLEEAYRHPEEHKNLVVRVGGYSEYFYRLSDELKRMVIERTIQNEV